MKVDLAQELLNELGESLEHLETQQSALLQFLKDKGIVAEDEFAGYLERAGKTSSVRWRAARVRLDHLIDAEKMEAERAAEKEREGEKARAKGGNGSGPQPPQGEGTTTSSQPAGKESVTPSKGDEKAGG